MQRRAIRDRETLWIMQVRSKSSPAHLDVRFSGYTPFRTVGEHEDALCLIRRLMATPGVGIACIGANAATLEALNGSRSAAHVFKLTPLFGPDCQVSGHPVVVKIAPGAVGVGEKANYDKFVRSTLPTMCRPELLAFARTRDHSGLCYSFVGGNEGARMDTLTDYLQRGDTTQLELFLRSIFDLTGDTWYSPHLIREECDIAQRYLDRYFTRSREAFESEATLRLCAARYFNAQQKSEWCVIGRTRFPWPHSVLFATDRKRSYHSCILHGDLNTDNIIVAHDLTLIDFQRTGRGHVYEDLVHLEASVRINYPRDASFGEILETERRIALGQRQFPTDPYATTIQEIRDAAFRYFGRFEDNATYHFAVAAIGLRLMRAVDISHVARARITASALWAAKALTGELSA